jgi:hypothetical protein
VDATQNPLTAQRTAGGQRKSTSFEHIIRCNGEPGNSRVPLVRLGHQLLERIRLPNQRPKLRIKARDLLFHRDHARVNAFSLGTGRIFV